MGKWPRPGRQRLKSSRITASDANYHARHADRTLRRAKCIALNITSQGHVLDVGCNQGITSQYLLDCGRARRVTGVEFHEATVDESLRVDPRFELIEGDIVDIDLQDRYDVIVYGAVHHHILNVHGLTAAVATLQKLARQCDGQLFFETGQIAEGGRWPWQRAMRNYFRTDEEHFFYLLRSIEEFIEGFESIGEFWIHGIRRSYLRIDIGQSTAYRDFEQNTAREIWPALRRGPYVRTFGSRQQSLRPETEVAVDDSPVFFWTTEDDGVAGKFLKQYRHHPISALAEYAIGRQIEEDWAVKPVGITESPCALVFPLLKGAVPISSFARAPSPVRRKLACQVLAIFEDARRTRIDFQSGYLLPTGSSPRLIDLCDFNANNLLVESVDGHDIVRVVDFEQQSANYAYRNHMHLAQILWRLRQHRILAVTSYISGFAVAVWLLLRSQSRSFSDRVRARQPSLVSLVVADMRSLGGRLLGAVLRLIGLGER